MKQKKKRARVLAIGGCVVGVLIIALILVVPSKPPLLFLHYTDEIIGAAQGDGKIIVTGSIKSQDWQFDRKQNAWLGKLERFTAQLFPADSEWVTCYENSGLGYIRSGKMYTAEFAANQKQSLQPTVPLYVVIPKTPTITGETPGELLFLQQLTGQDISTRKFFDFLPEYFTVAHKSVNGLEVLRKYRIQGQKIEPCIRLDIQEDSSSPWLPEWTAELQQQTVGLEFFDQAGIRRATQLWEPPYAPKVFPGNVGTYNYLTSAIRLLTPMSYRQYTNTIDGQVSLTDFSSEVTETAAKFPLRKLTVSYDMLTSIGGDPTTIYIIINDAKNTTLFDGVLQNAEFVPEEGVTAYLSSERYTFEPIRLAAGDVKIDIQPLAWLGEVVVSQPQNNEFWRQAGALRFMVAQQFQQLTLAGETYRGRVPFPFEYGEQQVRVRPVEMSVCTNQQGQEFASPPMILDPRSVSSDGSISVVMPESAEPIGPEMVIIISGNVASTRKYWITARKAVAQIMKETDTTNIRIFFSDQGHLEEIRTIRDLNEYLPADTATNYYVDEEIQFAINDLLADNPCGILPDTQLVYIARNPGFHSYQQYPGTSLDIISPDPAPAEWRQNWHTAATEEDITRILSTMIYQIF